MKSMWTPILKHKSCLLGWFVLRRQQVSFPSFVTPWKIWTPIGRSRVNLAIELYEYWPQNFQRLVLCFPLFPLRPLPLPLNIRHTFSHATTTGIHSPECFISNDLHTPIPPRRCLPQSRQSVPRQPTASNRSPFTRRHRPHDSTTSTRIRVLEIVLWR